MKTKITSGINIPQQVAQPVGGSMQSVVDEVSIDAAQGAVNWQLPLTLPAARLTPELRLRYNSHSGNGIFGEGFSLNHLSISRMTQHGVPHYNGNDTYVSSQHGELVEVETFVNETAIPGYKHRCYRPRVDNAHVEFVLYEPDNSNDSRAPQRSSFWLVREADGHTHCVGDAPWILQSEQWEQVTAVVQDSQQGHIFQWLLKETSDARGNKIYYQYNQGSQGSQDENIPNPQRYLQSILYGNYRAKQANNGIQSYAFEVRFDYTDTIWREAADISQAAEVDDADLSSKKRYDSIKNYRPGFLVETEYLCRRIEIWQHFSAHEEANNVLAHYWQFHYNNDSALVLPEPEPDSSESSRSFDDTSSTDAPATQQTLYSLSCLTKLESVGCRRDNVGKYLCQALPEVSFEYTALNDLNATIKNNFDSLLLVEDALALQPELNGKFQLFDLYREGLPGILYTDEHTALFWRSMGDGKFAQAKPLSTFAFDHDRDSVQYLAALGEDKQLALVVRSNDAGLNGFYRLKPLDPFAQDADGHDIDWEPFQSFENWPMGVSGMPLDLDSSGQSGYLDFNAVCPQYFPANGEQGYKTSQNLDFAGGTPFSLTNSDGDNTLRTFADIYGDGLLHRVEISDGQMRIWPNLGHGRFAQQVTLSIPAYTDSEVLSKTNVARESDNLSTSMQDFNSESVFLVDIDGSGMADLVYAYTDKLLIYPNHGGQFSTVPSIISFPAHVRYNVGDQLSFGDIFGNGTTTLLLSQMFMGGYQHWQCCLADHKPYLLAQVSSTLGLTTTFTYTTSTKNYLQQRTKPTLKARYPVLPFATPVVARVTQQDEQTGITFLQHFEYHGGYYDFRERDFSGFAFVERWQKHSRQDASEHIPTFSEVNYTRRWYACGVTHSLDADSDDEQDQSLHYPTEDYFIHAAIAPINSAITDATSQDHINTSRANTHVLMRQAGLAVNGSLLREEVYAAQDFPRQNVFAEIATASDTSSLTDSADSDAELAIPYHVTDKAYHVIRVQASTGQNIPHAVMLVNPRENIQYIFERDGSFPRIDHTAYLAWTADYANCIEQAQLFYGHPDASAATILSQLNTGTDAQPSLAAKDADNLKALQQKTMVLYQRENFYPASRVQPSADTTTATGAAMKHYSFKHIRRGVEKYDIPANSIDIPINQQPIAFVELHNKFQHLSQQAEQLVTYRCRGTRWYYWQADLNDVALDGDNDIGLPLLHHEEHWLGTKEQVSQWHTPLLQADETLSEMLEQLGYISDEKNYWMTDHVYHYANPQANRASSVTDSFVHIAEATYYQPVLITHNITAHVNTETIVELATELRYRQEIVYDDYQLAVVEQINTLWQGHQTRPFSRRTLIDYQSMQPAQEIDYNDNCRLKVYSPLGQLLAYTQDGLLNDHVLGNPLVQDTQNKTLSARQINEMACALFSKLQRASLEEQLAIEQLDDFIQEGARKPHDQWLYVTYTDYTRHVESPAYRIQLRSKEYTHQIAIESADGTALEDSAITTATNVASDRIMLMVEYFDSLGHVRQTSVRAEANEVIHTDGHSTTNTGGWLTSGNRLHTHSGQLIQRSLPSYVETGLFEVQARDTSTTDTISSSRITYYYDALGRLRQQTTAKGFIKQWHIHAWGSSHYDENDTALTALNEGDIDWDEGEDVRTVTELSQNHQYTPSLHLLAAQGEPCAFVEIVNDKQTSAAHDKNTTAYYQVVRADTDVLGQVQAYFDARLMEPSIRFSYNGIGDMVQYDSPDAGVAYRLENVYGHLSRQRQGDWLTVLKRDNWQRLIARYVNDKTEPDNQLLLIEQKEYGESRHAPSQSNLCGQLVRWQTEDTLTHFTAFDLQGRAIMMTEKILVPNIDALVQYESAAPQPLANDIHESHWQSITCINSYNALGRLQWQVLPAHDADSAPVRISQTYNATNLLEAINIALLDEVNTQSVIKKIDYHASGKPTQTEYGNGLESTCDYEPTTQRLIHASCTAKDKLLQSQYYTYDPVGHIISIRQEAAEVNLIGNHHLSVPENIARYSYNSRYQLINSSGLQLQQSPLSSDLERIPHCNFADNQQPVSFQIYQQRFSYDNADNLTQIDHTASAGDAASTWTLDYGIAADSNQLQSTQASDSPGAGTLAYNATGSMTDWQRDDGSKQTLAWRYDQQLRFFEQQPQGEHTAGSSSEDTSGQVVPEKASIKEYYGYRSNDRSALFTQKLSNESAARTPLFFAAQTMQAKQPTGTGELLFAITERAYKVLCIELPSGERELIEHVYAHGCERKRVWQLENQTHAASNDPIAKQPDGLPDLADATTQMQATLILERHSINITHDDLPIATKHTWLRDDLQRECNQQPSPAHPTEQLVYHIADHLNSVVIDVDSAGDVDSYQAYQAYGSHAYLVSADERYLYRNDYYYSGQTRDVSGLYYYGERYYAPQLGRWIAPDPAGLVDGLNVYGFVQGNPIGFVDKWGLVGSDTDSKRTFKGKEKEFSVSAPIESASESEFVGKKAYVKSRSSHGSKPARASHTTISEDYKSTTHKRPSNQMQALPTILEREQGVSAADRSKPAQAFVAGYSAGKKMGEMRLDTCHFISAQEFNEIIDTAVTRAREYADVYDHKNLQRLKIEFSAYTKYFMGTSSRYEFPTVKRAIRKIFSKNPIDRKTLALYADHIKSKFNKVSDNLAPGYRGVNRAIKQRRDTPLDAKSVMRTYAINRKRSTEIMKRHLGLSNTKYIPRADINGHAWSSTRFPEQTRNIRSGKK